MLRTSVLRMAVGLRRFNRTGQLGDGREAAVAHYVETHARRGDIDDVIATMDRFAYEQSFLVNIGDQKGKLLDAAVRRADPRMALELGTYCGYSALRIARAAPNANVVSVERFDANADIAQRIWVHAAVDDRVWCAGGWIGDGGKTLQLLESEYGIEAGGVDFLFIDHDKTAYLSDLQRILGRGWLRTGSIVVADNIRTPGAPKYRAYMREQHGKRWSTVEHKTTMEYQTLLPDLVLESELLGER